jgi:hypothetical protein
VELKKTVINHKAHKEGTEITVKRDENPSVISVINFGASVVIF